MIVAKVPVVGIILGDQAGIGPEVVAKAIAHNEGRYLPVLFGNRALFEQIIKQYPYCAKLKTVPADTVHADFSDGAAGYFVDVPAGPDISIGRVSGDSGKLIYDSIAAAIRYHRAGQTEGLVMAPITKHALYAAGIKFSSEFEIFADLYAVPSVKSVIKCEGIFRSTVVGHCPFIEIVGKLNTGAIIDTANDLLAVMRMFMPIQECKIAIAALNPHAGEDGLFGSEEAEIIAPAVESLLKAGYQVIGPCPADTVFLKARSGEVGGIVYLYHDQGNIAMKSSFFGAGVLIYTKIPGHIVSVGHGSALDIAGKNIADANNLIVSIDTLLNILKIENPQASQENNSTRKEANA
ncbi:MAG TPA: 4-hydroxythreonine-4-phosphate dehydrogenase PdxA [Rectinemataceae bacterium]|nr:4-hydroxythreonine-4-phosphate dehydrogenase PdxA [Rectinemataceae bacterium]